jgi:hypothetical protein
LYGQPLFCERILSDWKLSPERINDVSSSKIYRNNQESVDNDLTTRLQDLFSTVHSGITIVTQGASNATATQTGTGTKVDASSFSGPKPSRQTAHDSLVGSALSLVDQTLKSQRIPGMQSRVILYEAIAQREYARHLKFDILNKLKCTPETTPLAEFCDTARGRGYEAEAHEIYHFLHGDSGEDAYHQQIFKIKDEICFVVDFSDEAGWTVTWIPRTEEYRDAYDELMDMNRHHIVKKPNKNRRRGDRVSVTRENDNVPADPDSTK